MKASAFVNLINMHIEKYGDKEIHIGMADSDVLEHQQPAIICECDAKDPEKAVEAFLIIDQKTVDETEKALSEMKGLVAHEGEKVAEDASV